MKSQPSNAIKYARQNDGRATKPNQHDEQMEDIENIDNHQMICQDAGSYQSYDGDIQIGDSLRQT